MRRQIVLALEQAMSLPSGTWRFVQQGWRVIRVEATPGPGPRPGDPNRYVGPAVDLPDRHAYFFGPNAGKEGIALNLRSPRGRELLLDLVRCLPVDVFAVNTLPRRYRELGIDYERLAAANPGLIWVGISAFGPEQPDVPGYDPALQAELGYMDLTGEPSGPPLLCGVPVVDLKAGDEAFAQVCLALAERAETGRGQRIDISMAQAAASWLIPVIPLLDLGTSGQAVSRFGNEHREFVPVNVYPCRDGHIYLAVGNDLQWQRLCAVEGFGGLAQEGRATNAGRVRQRRALHQEIAALTKPWSSAELAGRLRAAGLVAAQVNPVAGACQLPAIASRIPRTSLADGTPVGLAPPAVDAPYLAARGGQLPSPPRYGQHTRAVLAEIGLDREAIERVLAEGAAWAPPEPA